MMSAICAWSWHQRCWTWSLLCAFGFWVNCWTVRTSSQPVTSVIFLPIDYCLRIPLLSPQMLNDCHFLWKTMFPLTLFLELREFSILQRILCHSPAPFQPGIKGFLLWKRKSTCSLTVSLLVLEAVNTPRGQSSAACRVKWKILHTCIFGMK